MRKPLGKLYGRVPVSVLMDPDLSGVDVRVFAGMARWVMQGDICCKSHTDIGLGCRVTPRQVRRSIKALILGGHICAASSNKPKAICTYQLNSDVFAQKQRDGVQEIVSAPSGGKRLSSVRLPYKRVAN